MQNSSGESFGNISHSERKILAVSQVMCKVLLTSTLRHQRIINVPNNQRLNLYLIPGVNLSLKLSGVGATGPK